MHPLPISRIIKFTLFLYILLGFIQTCGKSIWKTIRPLDFSRKLLRDLSLWWLSRMTTPLFSLLLLLSLQFTCNSLQMIMSFSFFFCFQDNKSCTNIYTLFQKSKGLGHISTCLSHCVSVSPSICLSVCLAALFFVLNRWYEQHNWWHLHISPSFNPKRSVSQLTRLLRCGKESSLSYLYNLLLWPD